jgi:5-formyltetrahydrofolate cyclo-ligase
MLDAMVAFSRGGPPHASEYAAHKAALRTHFRTVRAGITAEAYQQESAAIIARLAALPEVRTAHTLHAYWPHTGRREVDLRPFLRAMQDEGKRIVLPVVVGFEPAAGPTPRMTHRLFVDDAHLHPNRWGIEEPIGTVHVPLEAVDVVIVPALGAGRNGHRIGHGLGYYDEFLAGLRVPTLCPVFAACLVDAVPADPHDVPMDVIVTEDAVIRPGRS